ncbi:MAG TPA: sigma-70 family RNA polymerase sigma factor [Promineifilum sp.]
MTEELSFDVVRLAREGDSAAMTELYEHYRSRIYGYLFYRVGDTHQAEDLTAEVFLRVVEKLPGYRFQAIPFQAWLFQIARNLAIDHYRKTNAHPMVELDANLITNHESPEQATEWSVIARQLKQALDRLTTEQCDVIVLRFLVGMPVQQVAETLNKSEGSVKALQARGLEALHRMLSWRVYHDTPR